MQFYEVWNWLLSDYLDGYFHDPLYFQHDEDDEEEDLGSEEEDSDESDDDQEPNSQDGDGEGRAVLFSRFGSGRSILHNNFREFLFMSECENSWTDCNDLYKMILSYYHY